jgi:hypothetical protein
MPRATLLLAIRRTVVVVLGTVAATYFTLGIAQISLDGVPATATQAISWRTLFHLGSSAAAGSAAVAALLLIRSQLSRGKVALGVLLLLAAPMLWILPLVGHFTQVNPCLNLGKAPQGHVDSCGRG